MNSETVGVPAARPYPWPQKLLVSPLLGPMSSETLVSRLRGPMASETVGVYAARPHGLRNCWCPRCEAPWPQKLLVFTLQGPMVSETLGVHAGRPLGLRNCWFLLWEAPWPQKLLVSSLLGPLASLQILPLDDVFNRALLVVIDCFVNVLSAAYRILKAPR